VLCCHSLNEKPRSLILFDELRQYAYLCIHNYNMYSTKLCFMKKNYQPPTIEVIEVVGMNLLSGSASAETPKGFLGEIQNDILIDSPLNIL